MQLLYHTAAGTTRNTGNRLGGVPLSEYDGGEFVIMFPSYGAPRTGNHVPVPVKKFLAEHGDRLAAVVGMGNTIFGPEFCAGAAKVAERWGVPLLAKIDLVPTAEQTKTIQRFLERG